MATQSKLHVALLASPGLGHLIPIIELAKRLISQHGFMVTIFAVTSEAGQGEGELLRAAKSLWPPGVFNIVCLPGVVDVSKSELGPGFGVIPLMLAMVRATLHSLRSKISEMKVKPKAMIVDQFGTEAMKVVAKEFDMSNYVFIASNAWFLAYNLYFPYLKTKVDPNKPLDIPGCESIPGGDLLPFTFEPNSQDYADFVRIGRDITGADGILVNTCESLEPRTLEAFKDDMAMKSIVKVPVYPIGPVIRWPTQVVKSEVTEWLDIQPDQSVIYISFGSGGTLSTQQTMELAYGLELSKQRFIWVMRPPTDNDSAASLFKSVHNVDESISKCLPNGFLDRTRDLGLVVSTWVSQEVVLQHRSIGGFISHCGWNSVLESIVNGVPVIAWPLYAEQHMNATMLAERLGIAIRPRANPIKELVRREEIEKMVNYVMVDTEGFRLRKSVNELKLSAIKALKEGGSSHCALLQVAKDCDS